MSRSVPFFADDKTVAELFCMKRAEFGRLVATPETTGLLGGND